MDRKFSIGGWVTSAFLVAGLLYFLSPGKTQEEENLNKAKVVLSGETGASSGPDIPSKDGNYDDDLENRVIQQTHKPDQRGHGVSNTLVQALETVNPEAKAKWGHRETREVLAYLLEKYNMKYDMAIFAYIVGENAPKYAALQNLLNKVNKLNRLYVFGDYLLNAQAGISRSEKLEIFEGELVVDGKLNDKTLAALDKVRGWYQERYGKNLPSDASREVDQVLYGLRYVCHEMDPNNRFHYPVVYLPSMWVPEDQKDPNMSKVFATERVWIEERKKREKEMWGKRSRGRSTQKQSLNR